MSEQLHLFDVTSQPAGRAVTQAADALPDLAIQIRNLVGEEALIRLVQRWGGTHLDWPSKSHNIEHSSVVLQVAEEVGMAAAKALAEYFIGVRLHVPQCKAALIQVRNRVIKQALDRREPVPTLARRYKLSERQIFNIAKTPD